MENQETAMQDNYSSSMPTAKLDAYLADCNVNNSMQFWQENFDKFPKLYQLHLKHHCIPATSAVIERCSSAAGYIVNARRSRPTDQMLDWRYAG